MIALSRQCGPLLLRFRHRIRLTLQGSVQDFHQCRRLGPQIRLWLLWQLRSTQHRVGTSQQTMASVLSAASYRFFIRLLPYLLLVEPSKGLTGRSFHRFRMLHCTHKTRKTPQWIFEECPTKAPTVENAVVWVPGRDGNTAMVNQSWNFLSWRVPNWH